MISTQILHWANGIRKYTGKTRRRGLKIWILLESAPPNFICIATISDREGLMLIPKLETISSDRTLSDD